MELTMSKKTTQHLTPDRDTRLARIAAITSRLAAAGVLEIVGQRVEPDGKLYPLYRIAPLYLKMSEAEVVPLMAAICSDLEDE